MQKRKGTKLGILALLVICLGQGLYICRLQADQRLPRLSQ